MDDDSFFGFDTSIPLDDDGGGRIEEPSEEEYDALNDETFGAAINGDWEEAHESLVRLTDNFTCSSGERLNSKQHGNNDNRHRLASPTSSRGSSPFYGTRHRNPIADSDLELNLSGMKLDDVDINFGDGESLSGDLSSGINLDPSVWASQPLKPTNHTHHLDAIKGNNSLFSSINNNSDIKGLNINPADFLRQHISSPFAHQQQQNHHLQQQQQQQQIKVNTNTNGAFGLSQLPNAGTKPKICTVEDIERNIIMQQAMQKQQQQKLKELEQQQKQQQMLNSMFKPATSKTPTPVNPHPNQIMQTQQQIQHQQQQQQQQQNKGPPGFINAGSPPRPASNLINNLAQHPLNNMLQQPTATGNRLPPGFPLFNPGMPPGHIQQRGHLHIPPHPLLNQHGLPPNFPHADPRTLPNPHLPIALNNFAMHPNFNAMRASAVTGMYPPGLIPPAMAQSRMPTHPPNPLQFLHQQQANSMFNMRLVQEIQQNHPLLQNASRQMLQPQQQQQQQQQQQHANANANHQNQQRAGLKQAHQRRDGISANGNLPPEEYDEYANLMSIRDKHWLIGIQLSQLNTDTPYIDDYYFTVYRERKSQLSGNVRHSKAHKDNQLNHPFSQPKGHAQLVLVQLGNKNGTRNGQHRERHNSETSGGNNLNQEQKTPYIFTPLKFENSLGKLQYGSVTAPRKIIDADIMSGELNDNLSNNLSAAKASGQGIKLPNVTTGNFHDITISAQRKSRHILLHIETLYRIVLKLDDLENPDAIATIIMKKKKESERIAALEQLENANKTPEERAAEATNPQTVNPVLKNKFAYEIETKEALVDKLIAGLKHEKVMAMMNIRKGKNLIRRIMPYLVDNPVRWNVWISVLASLQNVYKKDREDTEGVLYALYPEFEKQILEANFDTTVKIAKAIPLKDKKINAVFCSRFGISSLVCLIIQVEQIYVKGIDPTLNEVNKYNWRSFLDEVATSLNRTLQSQTINATIESYSIEAVMHHFARFKDLQLDSLLALITKAKEQVN
ncbi:protein PAT1 homolog 1 isoform X2 [Teleopsis dalmanni]|uniref:protein PAT1 homolog 1 isoform X2 n=1 Tax=Teleopsis dalmanni TaxID=139649 RepID=UPI0018CEC0D4|nr:protein PAT1 homolog 1 isoform X2 [Teleopsis dalmanni]